MRLVNRGFHAWVTRHPRAILFTLAVVSAVAAVGVTRLSDEEDVVVFLPQDAADVRLFREVVDRFRSLRVALVGVEAPAGQDVLSGDVLGRMDTSELLLQLEQEIGHRAMQETERDNAHASGDLATWRRASRGIDESDAKISLLRSNLVQGAMIVTSGLGVVASNNELREGGGLRVVELSDDSLERLVGVFARTDELAKHPADHPLNLLWSAFKAEAPRP